MKSQQDLTPLVPQLNLVESDVASLRKLADTLVAHNIESYNALLVSSNGHADTRQWKEVRRKEGLHVYKERSTAYATSGSTLPCLPSLLLRGTVVGKLDDVMFVAAAATDEQIKLTSTCLQDGLLDSKVVQSVVAPSDEQPFRHIGVKWKLHHARDYVCIDTTGIATSGSGEQVGFSISHSVAFSQIPSFEKFGVERANMSVCWLFRQSTPETVECYTRGFFDFCCESNDLFGSLSMTHVASHWLSFSNYMDCAKMKKIVWRMRKLSGLPVNGPMALEPTDESPDLAVTVDKGESGCSVCKRSFGFLLRRTCKICQCSVCSSCSVKKLVCVLAPDRRTVLTKKRSFCIICMCEVTRSDALAIARDEIRELQISGASFEREPQDDESETSSGERQQIFTF
uniref:FYVE-type domain-containing protein n=1 Tax=Peronospora matthiolae TaxID=2874970 RepID=A0AAV1UUS9_9STRA